MQATDRFASFRPSAGTAEDLFSDLDEGPFTAPSPPVPAFRGRENPQKTAVSPASPVSPSEFKMWRGKFPLTSYLVALMKHPNIDQADPVTAAAKYGLSIEICKTYLDDEKRRRRTQN